MQFEGHREVCTVLPKLSATLMDSEMGTQPTSSSHVYIPCARLIVSRSGSPRKTSSAKDLMPNAGSQKFHPPFVSGPLQSSAQLPVRCSTLVLLSRQKAQPFCGACITRRYDPSGPHELNHTECEPDGTHILSPSPPTVPPPPIGCIPTGQSTQFPPDALYTVPALQSAGQRGSPCT